MIDDEKVRIFIGPGFQEEGKATFLRADVSTHPAHYRCRTMSRAHEGRRERLLCGYLSQNPRRASPSSDESHPLGFPSELKLTVVFLPASPPSPPPQLRPFVHLATDPDGGWSRGLPGKVENREEWYNQMASWIGNETPEQTDIRETEQARRFAEEQDRESKAAASEAEGGDKKVDA